MITLEELKRVLYYEEDKGDLIWKVSNGKNTKVGDIAGSINPQGYRQINYNYRSYKAHRLAWFYYYGKWPDLALDHINGIKDDNRICNLREATAHENAMNRKLQINNESGVPGVSFNIRLGKWVAGIRGFGKQIHLGNFDEKEEAIKVRKEAEVFYGYHDNHGRTS